LNVQGKTTIPATVAGGPHHTWRCPESRIEMERTLLTRLVQVRDLAVVREVVFKLFTKIWVEPNTARATRSVR